jgi:WD40 repeat protein
MVKTVSFFFLFSIFASSSAWAAKKAVYDVPSHNQIFSQSKKFVIERTDDKAWVHDLVNKKRLYALNILAKDLYTSIARNIFAFSADDSQIAHANCDVGYYGCDHVDERYVVVVDTATGKETSRITLDRDIQSVRFDQTGKYLLISVSSGGPILAKYASSVWNIATQKKVTDIPGCILAEYFSIAEKLVICHDSNSIYREPPYSFFSIEASGDKFTVKGGAGEASVVAGADMRTYLSGFDYEFGGGASYKEPAKIYLLGDGAVLQNNAVVPQVLDQGRLALVGLDASAAASLAIVVYALNIEKVSEPDSQIPEYSLKAVPFDPACDVHDGVFFDTRCKLVQIWTVDLKGSLSEKREFILPVNRIPVFSPDGKRIAVKSGDDVRIMRSKDFSVQESFEVKDVGAWWQENGKGWAMFVSNDLLGLWTEPSATKSIPDFGRKMEIFDVREVR